MNTSTFNLYIKPKQERQRMQIILQNGFLTFVRRYCGYDLGTTEIFNIIHDYFFDTKEIDLKNLKEKIENRAFATEGVFLKTQAKERLAAGLIDEYEKTLLVQDVLKRERVLICVKLFRQMLIENDIPLYITHQGVDTINKTTSSMGLCLSEFNFYELLDNNFESMFGAQVRYLENDLTQSMNLFFKEFNREDPIYTKFREDEDVDLFFKLYVEKHALQFFSMFTQPLQWSMKGETDNDVSLYIQNTYGMPSTKVNRFILPSLCNIKSRI